MSPLLNLISLITPGKAASVLDVGGTLTFWQRLGALATDSIRLTLVNLETVKPAYGTADFHYVAGNAMALPFPNASFDISFSNSVVEHMGSVVGQQRFAQEVRRVGCRYIVQTPSIWFPLEPHARIPLFQFLPKPLRALAIKYFRINYFPQRATYRECLVVADSTLLMSHKRLSVLFPESFIFTEKLLGFPKSYVALGGWSTADLRKAGFGFS